MEGALGLLEAARLPFSILSNPNNLLAHVGNAALLASVLRLLHNLAFDDELRLQMVHAGMISKVGKGFFVLSCACIEGRCVLPCHRDFPMVEHQAGSGTARLALPAAPQRHVLAAVPEQLPQTYLMRP